MTPRLLAGAPLQEIDPKEIVQEEEKSDLDQHVHRSSVCERQRLEGTQRLPPWGQQPALADTHFSLPTGRRDFGQVPPAPGNLSLLLSIPEEPKEWHSLRVLLGTVLPTCDGIFPEWTW